MDRAGTVWLVGMMGAGKSTVGRLLAERLGRPFFDADAEIEKLAGRSVAEIFAHEGEPAFRERERVLVEALRGSGGVVALGGGAIAQPALRRCLAGHGVVVHLCVSAETALARVGDADSRPLLADLSPAERQAKLEALMRERAEAYASADLSVDTEGRDPDTIAQEIAGGLAGLEAVASRGHA